MLGFSNDVEVTQDYSDDPERLAAGVAALVNGGGTAFFDAIKNACDKLNTAREGEPAARVLIVLSDGDDNASNPAWPKRLIGRRFGRHHLRCQHKRQ